LSFLAPFFGSFFGRAKNEQRKIESKRTLAKRSSVHPNEQDNSMPAKKKTLK